MSDSRETIKNKFVYMVLKYYLCTSIKNNMEKTTSNTAEFRGTYLLKTVVTNNKLDILNDRYLTLLEFWNPKSTEPLQLKIKSRIEETLNEIKKHI